MRNAAPGVLALLLLAAGCRSGGLGEFVWVHDLADGEVQEHGYVIAPGDTIQVRVYNQDGVSGRMRVRADGMISLPFLGDTQAAGFTPLTLAARIQVRLKEFIVNPIVTVSLEELRPFEVSVMGEVVRAGVYRLEPGTGVLPALAAAGGLNDFANRDRIFVLRGNQRIRFTFRALTQAQPKAATFRLRSADVLVVE